MAKYSTYDQNLCTLSQLKISLLVSMPRINVVSVHSVSVQSITPCLIAVSMHFALEENVISWPST